MSNLNIRGVSISVRADVPGKRVLGIIIEKVPAGSCGEKTGSFYVLFDAAVKFTARVAERDYLVPECILRELLAVNYLSHGSFIRHQGQANMAQRVAADLEMSVDVSNLGGVHHDPLVISARNIKGRCQTIFMQQIDRA
jgi:hypothetical protein